MNALEGKVNAHRTILIEMLVAILRDEKMRQALQEALRRENVVLDLEEDPGVLPTEAFAIEAGSAAEVRSILDEVFGRLDGPQR